MEDQSEQTEPLRLLRRWRRRCQSASLAHYKAARYYDACYAWLGGSLIVISIAAAVLAGRPLLGLTSEATNAAALFASAVTVSLASLQVFRNDASRADRHRRTAASYSSIKRDIEQMFVCCDELCSKKGALNDLKLRLRVVAEESLGVPGRIWRRVDQEAPYRTGEL